MSRDEIHEVVLEHLDLIENGTADFVESLIALERVLDQLALARYLLTINLIRQITLMSQGETMDTCVGWYPSGFLILGFTIFQAL